MAILSNEEKISIANQHLKNVEIKLYNLELSIIEENAKVDPDSSSLSILQTALQDINAQRNALEAEIESIQA